MTPADYERIIAEQKALILALAYRILAAHEVLANLAEKRK